MNSNSGVFVKVNCKSINEVKGLIIDRGECRIHENKYLMCAGKYDKNGWTVVFKARNREEAELLINTNPFNSTNRGYNTNFVAKMNNDEEIVQVPRWLS